MKQRDAIIADECFNLQVRNDLSANRDWICGTRKTEEKDEFQESLVQVIKSI